MPLAILSVSLPPLMEVRTGAASGTRTGHGRLLLLARSLLYPQLPFSFINKVFIYFISRSQLPIPSLFQVPPSPLSSLPSTLPPPLLRRGEASHGCQPTLAYQRCCERRHLLSLRLDEATQEEEGVPKAGNRVKDNSCSCFRGSTRRPRCTTVAYV